MNLKTWSKQHTYGLIIGILTTAAAIPLILLILSVWDNQSFSRMWFRFTLISNEKARIISLASIANLIWFHTYLNKEKYPFAMGVIMATVINLIVIVYYKFI